MYFILYIVQSPWDIGQMVINTDGRESAYGENKRSNSAVQRFPLLKKGIDYDNTIAVMNFVLIIPFTPKTKAARPKFICDYEMMSYFCSTTVIIVISIAPETVPNKWQSSSRSFTNLAYCRT